MDQIDRLNAALEGRYRVDGELGRGGMATVYLADDLRHERQVALKVLKPEIASVVGAERFLAEIKTTANLQHPHILPLHDSGESGGFVYYVTPYVRDESLRQRIDRVGQLPVDRAVQITKEIADALAYSHSLGIIHRDIKPSNILLSGGHALLADFGIAKALDSLGGDGLTQAGISLGTAEYMSPEQAAGDQILDVRTDIYSLGAVLYEMLVGEPPFVGQTSQVVLGKILTLRPTRPSDVREAIPDALDGAVMRALSRLPSDRFSFADHFAEALVTMDRRQGAVHHRRRPIAGRLAAGLGAVAIGWLAWTSFFGSSAGGTIEPPRPSPFLTGAAVLNEPDWSPSANLVVYISDEAGDPDVWVADASGMNPINLTAGSGFSEVHPAWSPDGSRIAFVSNRDGGGLYTMSALGGAPTRVAPVVFDGSTASSWVALQWASDGRIVYTSRDASGAPQAYGVGEDGAGLECLTCSVGPGAGQSGHILPGGRFFVFRSTHGPEPDGELYLTELATGRTETIARDVALPKWSADLQRLLYVSPSSGGLDLWAMEIDPGNGRIRGSPQRLTTGFDAAGMAIGPDRKVLVVRQRARSSVWALPTDRGVLAGLDAGQRLTTSEQFRDERPRWLSGSEIVFQSDRRGSSDLWRLSLAGGEPARLTSEPGAETSPHPNADGTYIAYEHAVEGVAMTRVLRPGGGAGVLPDTTWLDRFDEQCCPSWSPDGRRLAMAVTAGAGGRRIATAEIDPATGASTEITVLDVPGVSQSYPRWSPDGRRIAYEARGEGSWDIWVVDADGSNAKRVVQSPAHERQPTWAADGRSLFYRDDFRQVWRVPLDAQADPTGAPEQFLVMSSGQRVGEGGFDAREDQLLLAIEEHEGDIWLLEFSGPETR